MLKNEKIAKEIMEMVDTEQAERRKEDVDWSKVEEIDRKHTARLKEIIEEIGWPSIPKVGSQAAQGAWLLAQHADFDLPFQKKVIRLMKGAPRGDVDLSQMAFLTDRILIKEKGVQRYGTQLKRLGKAYLVHPLEDRDNLDKLRAEADLEPISEYTADFDLPVYLNEEEIPTDLAA